MQKTVNFTGIDDFLNHDACATESMGAIFDRSKEHLGVSDKAVIAVRRFLLEHRQGAAKPAKSRPIWCAIRRELVPAYRLFRPPGAARSVPWQKHFDYLTPAAQKENPHVLRRAQESRIVSAGQVHRSDRDNRKVQ